jgi:hypothetical protein
LIFGETESLSVAATYYLAFKQIFIFGSKHFFKSSKKIFKDFNKELTLIEIIESEVYSSKYTIFLADL